MDEQQELEQQMKLALDGAAPAVYKFFELFLNFSWVVPERYQSPAISNSTVYPNDFAYLLGIQSEGNVYVPAFSRAEVVSAWSGMNLSCKVLSGKALLDAVPDGWWLWLNPGMEVEKELSPWEIAELKLGAQGIEEIILELSDDTFEEPLTLHQEFSEQEKAVCSKLEEFLRAEKLVCRKAWAATTQMSEDNFPRFLVGLLMDGADSAKISEMEVKLQSFLEQQFIGVSEKVRVMLDTEEHGLSLGVFSHLKPLPTF